MPKLILNRREFAVGSAALVTAMSFAGNGKR